MKALFTTLPAVLLLLHGGTSAPAQAGPCTYQGYLTADGFPADGSYDLVFTVYDAETNGTALRSVTNRAADVHLGLFTVLLDFGVGPFEGGDRWLEIGAATNGGGAFTVLAPRQQITPTPYAVYAPRAGEASTAASAAQVTGPVDASQLVGTIASNNLGAGTITSDKIAAGTIAEENLSPALASNTFWRLEGNAGTAAAAHFLGTPDDEALELRVNGQRALRLDPGAFGPPSVTAGGSANSVLAGVHGATIGGGGGRLDLQPENAHWIAGHYATIGGGRAHTVEGYGSTIGGGQANTIETNCAYSVIPGGWLNLVEEHASYAAIAGGQRNLIQTNADSAVIGGGYLNTIEADALRATVGGGYSNRVHALADYATIAGGVHNDIGENADYATVGGGHQNDIASNAWSATIAGGILNDIGMDSDYSTIGGGFRNYVGDGTWQAGILAGLNNTIGVNSHCSTIGGGSHNNVVDHAPYAVIPGGENNSATNYAFAAGRRAKALHPGAFVWSDSTDADFASSGSNQFLVRAVGGVGIGTNAPQSALHVAGIVTASGFAGGDGLLSLGTSDDSPLEFSVGGERALRLEPAGSNSVNVVAGADVNNVTPGVVGATIGGGGAGDFYGQSYPNRVAAHFGTIAGGRRNTIQTDAYDTFIGGGLDNVLGTNANFSVIGGGSGNTIEPYAHSATIAGGHDNAVAGAYGHVAGGKDNHVGLGSDYGAIGGGLDNIIAGASTNGVIAGGEFNHIDVASHASTIGGGSHNSIEDDAGYAVIAGGRYHSVKEGARAATIGGGYRNEAGEIDATVGGGSRNQATGIASTIGGGEYNTASSIAASIGGGSENTASDLFATVAGGETNTASGVGATVGGGDENTASGQGATVAGGHENTASGTYAVVGGGRTHLAAGHGATVPGGIQNEALGRTSFAAGNQAKATHDGAFVWGDSTYQDISSTTNDQFTVRAANGVRFTENAGAAKPVGFGEHYRDNGLLAWGKVLSGGTLATECGVASVTHPATGTYQVTLDVSAADTENLVAVVTPEMNSLPTGASSVRLASINQTGGQNFFTVYTVNGNWTAADASFVFMVTGR